MITLLGGPPLQSCGFEANLLRAAQQLSVKTDTFEPIVQSQKVGKAHTAMDFSRGARDEAPHFRSMPFCMTSHEAGVVWYFVQRMARIPHE